jgi:hypothetical protein
MRVHPHVQPHHIAAASPCLDRTPNTLNPKLHPHTTPQQPSERTTRAAPRVRGACFVPGGGGGGVGGRGGGGGGGPGGGGGGGVGGGGGGEGGGGVAGTGSPEGGGGERGRPIENFPGRRCPSRGDAQLDGSRTTYTSNFQAGHTRVKAPRARHREVDSQPRPAAPSKGRLRHHGAPPERPYSPQYLCKSPN